MYRNCYIENDTVSHCSPVTQDCDLVVAVTHMRWHNDRRLAEEVPELDLILGGHDHDYQIEIVSDYLKHCTLLLMISPTD